MFILFIILTYLTIGTLLARRDYANRMSAHQMKDFEQIAFETRETLRAMNHGRDCWLGPLYSEKYDGSGAHSCDCHKSKKHSALVAKLMSAEDGVGGTIDGPYRMLFAWPFLGYHRFLIGGNAGVERKENARLELEASIERAERELGIVSLGYEKEALADAIQYLESR